MAINLQDIINKSLATIEATTKVAEAAPAPAVEAAPEVKVAEAAAPVATADADLQKVAAEMDEAGRVMARAFYDELQKIAVSAHGYVDSAAEQVRENPAVQVSMAPERMENASKAIQIITQLTAGERVKGPEGYIQVNGQPVDGTAPEIPVEEHPVAVDATKRADAKLITALYTKYFPEA